MNNNELPPMEQSDVSIENTAIEKQGEEEKIFDPEKGKQEYADARLEWARLEAEYNSISEQQSGFADAVIANKENAAALLGLRTAGMKLEEIRGKRDQAGDKSGELFNKLLEAEGGAKNIEAAETLFEEGLTKFIKENPDLAGHLVEGGSFIPGYAESAERIKSLAEMQVEANTLRAELSGLNAEAARLKAEKEQKEAEQKELAKDSEHNAAKLKQNISDRQGILQQMKEVTGRLNELAGKFEEFTARVRETFAE